MNSFSIERRIIIGLIVSTPYIKQINKLFNLDYLKSDTARLLAGWCLCYFNKYEKAPFKNIEDIFFDKIKNGKINKELAEEIEQDILPSLSDEYEREEKFNVAYLIDKTKEYFKQRKLELHKEEIERLIEAGKVEEAEKLATEFEPLPEGVQIGLELPSEEALKKIEQAFENEVQGVIKYPGALGEMWNNQLVRGGFVAIQASEKRGKTFLLLELALRAVVQKCNVAFFQAGDMTEMQQLRRICLYVSKKPDKEVNCGEIYVPIKDCILNQINKCEESARECYEGVFLDLNRNDYRKKITFDMIKEVTDTNKDYKPCHNCKKWEENGTVWYKKINIDEPLTVEEAKNNVSKFFNKYKKRFKLVTYPNQSLTITEIKSVLNVWEDEEGFVPDVIIIDYADLLVCEKKLEFRHQQNYIWQALRGLSQEKHCLVITPTQANAGSYSTITQKLNNFSEDKRKYAHVTAMYGLNQDPDGRERKLGLMRINELVVREGEPHDSAQVCLIQKLSMGKPYLGSFRVYEWEIK